MQHQGKKTIKVLAFWVSKAAIIWFWTRKKPLHASIHQLIPYSQMFQHFYNVFMHYQFKTNKEGINYEAKRSISDLGQEDGCKHLNWMSYEECTTLLEHHPKK